MLKRIFAGLSKNVQARSYANKNLTGLLKNYSIQRYFSVSRSQKLPFEKHREIKEFLRVVYRRLEKPSKEYTELSKMFLQSGEIDPSKLEETRKKMDEISNQHAIFEQLHNLLTSLEELHKMKKETKETELETIEILEEEIENAEDLLQETEEKAIELLVPPAQYDDCNAINIEIRPGVGGSESSLFADDIIQMFQSYIPSRGWNCKLAQYQTDGQIGKGCKFGQIKASGQDIYKYMKCESGVHKVIRVPETEKMGRLHSSTISVVVLPDIPMNFQLDEKELKIEFMRASGAGGQHVNKTESACRATHIPTGISVFIQDDRTQHTNKAKAIAILKERIFTMEVLKNQENLHSQRKEQMASGDRSDKIRTYNFPQARITDHRTGLTLYGIEKMLQGELLDQFIDEYQKKIYETKIAELMEQVDK